MASFRDTIYDLIKASLQAEASGNQATGATLSAVETFAGRLADAIANAAHSNLVGKVNSASSAMRGVDASLGAFMAAFSGWQPNGTLGDAPALKGACGASAAQTVSALVALTSALSVLESTIASYTS